jgi:hypothetical protein
MCLSQGLFHKHVSHIRRASHRHASPIGHLIGVSLICVHLLYAYLSHRRVSPIGHLIGMSLIGASLIGASLIGMFLTGAISQACLS